MYDGDNLEELYEILADVRVSLPMLGSVVDQATSEVIRYDPDRIAPQLQHTIMAFMSDPPRMPEGHKKWLVVLSSRQVTKSVTTALALYMRTAFTPGVYSAIIADTKERSEDLFRAITNCHQFMREDARPPTIPNRESRQLTFTHNGKIRTLSAQANMVGIGRAVDNLHLSELPFWPDAAEAWSGIYPAVVNRKEAAVIMESTPAPLHFPSAEWYRDICAEARKGLGRWLFLFVPYFKSNLNERQWDPRWVLTTEELRMLERFGPKGNQPESAPRAPYLTLENLAFRRQALIMDPELRRHPDLFNVFYPSDPLTCWVQAGGAAIPAHALDRHRTSPDLVPWAPRDGAYMEYEPPEPGALYVIGVDPAGWMGGDQASFVIFKCWAEEWVQVASFSSNTIDPSSMAKKIIEAASRYNDAMVVVESNGVGLGTLTPLVEAANRKELKNLYYDRLGVPGIAATSKSVNTALGLLIDALMDRLVLRDEELVEQMATYKHDKLVEEGEAAKILDPGRVPKRRRAKHHWDRVSATLWAVFGAHRLPVRYKPKHTRLDLAPGEVETLASLPADEWVKYQQQLVRDEKRRQRRSRR